MLGQEVEAYIAQQIRARQNLYNNAGNRSQTKLNVLSNQNAWVKLASGVALESEAQKQSLKKSKTGSFQKSGNPITFQIPTPEFDKLNSQLTPEAKDKISKLNLPTAKIDDKEVQINKNSLVGTQLAKFFVLFNGLSSLKNGKLENRQGFGRDGIFSAKVVKSSTGAKEAIADVSNNSYNKSDFGIVPMPGIVDFNIKSLNRGSIKKATMKIKAHSREHFEILELLYLRLGYTVLVEYGNNIYYDEEITTPTITKADGTVEEKEVITSSFKKVNTTLIDDEEKGFFSEEFANNGSYLKILGQIQGLTEQYSGNYGGFLGKVVNFEWTIDELGSYDITLNLISLGDVIESLKINLSLDSTYTQFLKSIGDIDDASIEQKDIIGGMLYAHRRINRDSSSGKNIPVNVNQLSLENEQNPFAKQFNLLFRGNENKNAFRVGFLMNAGDEALNSRTTYVQFKFRINREIYDNARGRRGKPPGSFKYTIYKDKKTGISKFSYTEVERRAGKIKKDGNKYRLQYTKEKLEAFNLSTVNRSANYFNERAAIESGKSVDQFEIWSYDDTKIDNPCKDFDDRDGFVTFQQKGERQHYIRLGALMKFVNNQLIPGVLVDNGEFEQICRINLSPSYLEDGMYTIPNQISLDPRVCIVKNTVVSYGTENGVYEVFDKLRPFREFDLDEEERQTYKVGNYVEDGQEYDGTPINPNRAYIPNIYLNHNFIEGILSNKVDDKGDISLYAFFKEICVGINKALGGINTLEPIVNEKDNSLRIVDFTAIPGQVEQQPKLDYKLNLVGFSPDGTGNFIRKLDIKTTITPDFASMITIGSTAGGYVKGTNGTAFSKWNSGLVDRFKPELKPNNLTESQKQKNKDQISPTEPQENYINNFLNQQGKNSIWAMLGGSYLDTGGNSVNNTYYGPLNSNTIEKNLSTVSEFYKYALAVKTQKTKGPSVAGASGIGFIPFKLSFTINGMEGIKIYNTLHINSSFLPQSYGKSLGFIATGVDHNFKNNDWETTITTIVQPKSLATGIEETTSILPDYNYLFTEEFFEEFEEFTPTTVVNAGKSPTVLEVAFNEDQAPIINPTRQGARGYSSSPVAVQQRANKQQNGLLKQTDPKVLVFIGETQGAKRYYINPVTKKPEYMLHPSAAEAWYKWRDEMKAKGVSFRLNSAYRSVVHQEGLGSGKTVATAGSSPHGWGGAIDLINLYRIVGGSGSPATNLEGRKTQAYYDIASIGAKYGWYNPHRLADNYGLDEMWHFEYWGPV